MAQKYTQYDSLAAEYDDWYTRYPKKWNIPSRNEFLISVLEGYPVPATIIDIGCGNGHTLERIANVYPFAELYGLDLSSEGLKLVKEKLPNSITVHSALEYYTNKKFDLVICLGTAEHFEELDKNLVFLKKITGRLCYFEVPHNLVYDPGEHNYHRLEVGSHQWEWHLTREEWEEKLINAGFNIVDRYTGQSATWEFVWILE